MGGAALGSGMPAASPVDSDKELSPRAVLIVDDEPSICLLLAEMLQATGHPILTAGSVADAMGHVRTRTVAVVIVDVQLGGADGLALLQQALDPAPGAVADWLPARAQIECGTALLHRNRLAEAADYLQRGYDLMLAAHGKDDLDTQAAVRLLVKLCEKQGRPADAAKWRAKLT